MKTLFSHFLLMNSATNLFFVHKKKKWKTAEDEAINFIKYDAFTYKKCLCCTVNNVCHLRMLIFFCSFKTIGNMKNPLFPPSVHFPICFAKKEFFRSIFIFCAGANFICISNQLIHAIECCAEIVGEKCSTMIRNANFLHSSKKKKEKTKILPNSGNEWTHVFFCEIHCAVITNVCHTNKRRPTINLPERTKYTF